MQTCGLCGGGQVPGMADGDSRACAAASSEKLRQFAFAWPALCLASSTVSQAGYQACAGLTTRAKVSAAGVTVGRVVGIRYDKATAAAIVDMEISQDFAEFSEDTSASILTAGLLGEKYIGLSTGGDPNNLADGDMIYDTQSAIVLEELIGKFLLNMSSEK